MFRIIQLIIKISRPRFWLYTAGPYLIGFSLGHHLIIDYFTLNFLYGLFFFLIPANSFMYGLNDIFDKETDRFNPKKTSKETKITSKNSAIYIAVVTASALLSAPLILTLSSISTFLLFCFLFLSFFYSVPPLRFKSKPFIDSASNILYAFPGFIAFSDVSHWQSSCTYQKLF